MFTRSRRGLTLAEVLVASAIFMLASLALMLTEKLARQSATKVDAASDTYRMAMLTLRRVEEELRGVRLMTLGPNDDPPYTRLEYKMLRLDGNGQMMVNIMGQPLWIPGGVNHYTIELDSSRNLVFSRAPGQVMGRLGDAGTLEFSLPESEDTHLLLVKVHAEVTDNGGRAISTPYDASSKIFLWNGN